MIDIEKQFKNLCDIQTLEDEIMLLQWQALMAAARSADPLTTAEIEAMRKQIQELKEQFEQLEG